MHASALSLLPLLAATTAASSVAAHNSFWYDWGLYGAYPRRSYESFSSASPWVNLVKSSDKCEDAYTFIEPRGNSVPLPGPVILDNHGNLVWMETKYGQAMDVKVQTYQGNHYITFWHGGDSGWFGRGYYLMIDSSYNVFKNVTAAGDLDGDLHEFQITDRGTALLTVYDTKAADLSAYGVQHGQIIDSLFQEIDLETGELIFQWRASDHYPVTESLAPYESYKGAWDYFHINSVDKDTATGNYVISSRYMCGVAMIDATSGQVVWQVGGKNNSFTDLSDGEATNFSWQHHTRLLNNGTLLTVFDNGAYYNKPIRRAEHSRGLMIDLDTTAMTAELRHALVAPRRFLSPSQGSVNVMPETGNVLVGWGHTPAWTEFDAITGEVLCDTHLGAAALDFLGWCKNYRTFKSKWVGRPATMPDAVLKQGEQAIYVSWNGATEVERWVVRTAWASDDEDAFVSLSNITSARKQSFETRIDVSALEEELGSYVQVQAYDRDGLLLGSSEWIDTETGLYKSGTGLPVSEKIGIQKTQLIMSALALGAVAVATLIVLLRRFLFAAARLVVIKAKGAVVANKHQYNALPQIEITEAQDSGAWNYGQLGRDSGDSSDSESKRPL